MTNKTMPERIYAWALDDRQEWSDASETDADFDDAEYVRADIAANLTAKNNSDEWGGRGVPLGEN